MSSYLEAYGAAEQHRARIIEIVEPFDGSAIDIGEAAAQQLALALDPYPRAAGASLAGSADAADPAGEEPPKG